MRDDGGWSEEQGGESWAATVAGDRNEGKLIAGGRPEGEGWHGEREERK